MAIRRTKRTTDPAPAESNPRPAPGAAAGSRPVVIQLKRPTQVGADRCDVGHELAQITLADGCTLNYLVDAIRNGLAGPVS